MNIKIFYTQLGVIIAEVLEESDIGFYVKNPSVILNKEKSMVLLPFTSLIVKDDKMFVKWTQLVFGQLFNPVDEISNEYYRHQTGIELVQSPILQ